MISKNINNTYTKKEEAGKKKYPAFKNPPPQVTAFNTFCYNPLSLQHDREIITLYGGDFVKFFHSGQCTRLPMFTEPPTPRSVKRILFDKTIKFQEGEDAVLMLAPFVPHFVGTKSPNVMLGDLLPSATIEPFVGYKIVCLKVRFKQVGIDSPDSTLNAQLDMAIVPPGTTAAFALQHFLSMQVASGDRITMVDGRTGVMACLLGSPNFPMTHTDVWSFVPNLVTGAPAAGAPVQVPALTTVTALPNPEGPDTALTGDGQTTTLQPGSPQLTTFNADTLVNGTIMAQVPYGPQIAIRVSAPPADVTFKLYCDVVVEGQVKPTHLLNMPQISPPNFFDFGALERAFTNTIPRVTQMDDSSPYMPGLGLPLHPIPGFHAANTLQAEVDQDGNLIGVPEYTAFASNVPKVDPVFKVKGSAQMIIIPELPVWMRAAIEYLPTIYSSLDSSTAHNRLGVDTTLALPDMTYQFFPITGERGVEVAMIVVDHQIASGKNSLLFGFKGVDGKPITVKVAYNKEDWMEPELFTKILTQVVNFLYGAAYHSTSSLEMTVRAFSPTKFKGESYMLALHAALIGAPSGQFLTGSYTWDGKALLAGNLTLEAVEEKSVAASGTAPLLALGATLPDGMLVNIQSGTIPLFADGRAIPTNSPSSAFIYILTPLKSRGISSTPIKYMENEIRANVLAAPSPIRRYIATYLITKPTKITELAKGASLGVRDFLRANPSRFATYIDHKKRAILATDFYKQHPDLLQDAPHFSVKGTIFVDPYVMKGHVRQVGAVFLLPIDDNFVKARAAERAMLQTLTSNDVDALLQTKLKSISPEILAKDIKSVLPKENASPNAAFVERLKGKLTDLPLFLASFKNFADQYKGNNQALLSVPQGGDTLALLGIPTRVIKDAPLGNIKTLLDYLTEFISAAGAAGVVVAAHLAGWGFLKQTPRITTQHLNNVEKFIQENPVPVLEAQDAGVLNQLNASNMLIQFNKEANPPEEIEINTNQVQNQIKQPGEEEYINNLLFENK